MLRTVTALTAIASITAIALAEPQVQDERELRALTGIAIAGNPHVRPLDTSIPEGDSSVLLLSSNETRVASSSHLRGEAGAKARLAGETADRRRAILEAAGGQVGAEPVQVAALGGAADVAPPTTARGSAPSGPGAQGTASTTASEDLATPEELAREIQVHLRALGCYRGRIDGIWGRGSRAALRRADRDVAAPRRTSDVTAAVLDQVRALPETACRKPARTQIAGRSATSDVTPRQVERRRAVPRRAATRSTETQRAERRLVAKRRAERQAAATRRRKVAAQRAAKRRKVTVRRAARRRASPKRRRRLATAARRRQISRNRASLGARRRARRASKRRARATRRQSRRQWAAAAFRRRD